MTFTLVSFHAHPDDEALLTGGTLARAAAEGHRVVLVTATDGAAGLTSASVHASAEASGGLGRARLRELEQAAAVLGAARVVHLGFPDGAFSTAGVDLPATLLAEILEQERADVLTGYDAAGGYGHPDHVHVHHVARRAAGLANTPVLLEATIDRRLLLRGARLISVLPGAPVVDLDSLSRAYSDRREITHTVDVSAHLTAKLAALAAHGSQAVGSERSRTAAFLTGLPRGLTRPVLGREWFIERGREPGGHRVDDIFAGIR